jgi:hypothetical protein
MAPVASTRKLAHPSGAICLLEEIRGGVKQAYPIAPPHLPSRGESRQHRVGDRRLKKGLI